MWKRSSKLFHNNLLEVNWCLLVPKMKIHFTGRNSGFFKQSFIKRHYSVTIKKSIDVVINDAGVATVTLQRPPVNALNLELLQELTSTLDDLEKSKCRGMILTSSLPTVFTAGLDIKEMCKPKPDRIKAFWSALQGVWLKLYGSSFPTVAAINGHSPAGGCLLAVCCDYRVMVGPSYRIGPNETQLGIVIPIWFQETLKRVIAPRQAEMAFTLGKMFSATEAKEIALVDELVANKDQAVTKAEEYLARFSGVSDAARMITKLSLRREPIEWMKENKDADLELFISNISQPKNQIILEKYLESLKNKGR